MLDLSRGRRSCVEATTLGRCEAASREGVEQKTWNRSSSSFKACGM